MSSIVNDVIFSPNRVGLTYSFLRLSQRSHSAISSLRLSRQVEHRGHRSCSIESDHDEQMMQATKILISYYHPKPIRAQSECLSLVSPRVLFHFSSSSANFHIYIKSNHKKKKQVCFSSSFDGKCIGHRQDDLISRTPSRSAV